MEQYYFGSGLDYFDSALEENSFNLQLQNTSKQNSTLVNNYETTQLAVFCSPTWNYIQLHHFILHEIHIHHFHLHILFLHIQYLSSPLTSSL